MNRRRRALTVLAGEGDAVAPTVAITCAQSSPSADATLNFTITFSEPVTGFEVGDFVITNGTKGALGGSGAVYTCDVTPAGMSIVTANVSAGVAIDTAGNENTAANEITITSTLTFTDDFAVSKPQWAGATWSVAGGVAFNTPVPGASVVTNGEMEAGNPPTGWNAQGTPTTYEASGVQKHGGAASLHVVADAANEGGMRNVAVTIGRWYRVSAWKYRIAGGGQMIFSSGMAASVSDSGNTNTWFELSAVDRATGANPEMYIRQTGASGESYFDDAAVQPLVLTELFRLLPASVASVTAEVVVAAMKAGTQAGLVINVDSPTTPLNFVLAYTDRVTAYLVQCVNGTYTVKASGAITYGAAKILKVIKNGTTYQLFYDGTQVGADQTINAMNGTYHGLFSTYPSNTLEDFSLSATPF